METPRKVETNASASVHPAARVVSFPFTEPKPAGWVRFVCFSDTHGLHEQIAAEYCPQADVLLHAGDFTNTGELEQVKSLVNWLQRYPATHKVVIAGNHDVTFEPSYYERMSWRYHPQPYRCSEVRAALLESKACVYLEDQVAEILGYQIYGSPWQPAFCDWAFNLDPGEALRQAWVNIPSNTDILITHGPPHGKGDLLPDGMRVGCKELAKAVHQRRTPVHLFGHIHEGYGVEHENGTMFINASTCTIRYAPTNPPVVFDLPPPGELRTLCPPVTLSSSPDAPPADSPPTAPAPQ